MRDTNNNLSKKIFGSYVFLFVLIIIASMITFSYARTYYNDYQIKQEIVGLQEKANKLKTQKIKLLEELDYVKSNSFVEEVAKTELNLANNGEKVIMIQSSSTQSTYVDRQLEDVVIELTNKNYSKWFNIFITNQ